jgi:50S ribosomal subunit-associated GTPase HflX
VGVTGADVVLVGQFSAKEKNFVALMDAAAAELTARGARVVGRITQRRGVSDGGVRKMNLPYSSRTLLSSGKVLEVAALCEETDADLVVFVTSLTGRQQNVLTGIFDRPVMSLAEIIDAG